MAVESFAFARAGLLGNPSDLYFGKIIAISVENFASRVTVSESKQIEITASDQDAVTYKSLSEFSKSIYLYGYYGGVRIIKAAIKKFYDYCRSRAENLEDRNFTIQYGTTIPRQLGLGGSSAIIVAAMRSLMKFYEVDIPREILPSLVLDAEREELGINAGFMDRVIQVYEGCVYMDLNAEIMREKGHGFYERIDSRLLPNLYLAYKPMLGKVSGRVLDDIRVEFEKGNPRVLKTLNRLAEVAEAGKQAILQGETGRLHDLMNTNFDLRSRIMTISGDNLEMVRTARRTGASAKFAGSGGSIVGIYEDEEMYSRLVLELGKLQARVLKPVIGSQIDSD